MTRALVNDLEVAVAKVFREGWSERDGIKIPETTDVQLSNDGVHLDAVVLYADMAESTKLVEQHSAKFAAEVYKAFLYCAARIIEYRGGTVTAYDGDRIMGVFIGDLKNSTAARAALNINHAVKKIVMPALQAMYTSNTYVLEHCCGIDGSKLLVARAGVRGANDLVWVGRAANNAAKLSALRISGYSTIISQSVYDSLSDESKYASGVDMWHPVIAYATPNVPLRGSTYWWAA